jgi:integrase
MRTGKLLALTVARAVRERKPGLLNDGGGLYLKNGSSWIFRYGRGGKKRDHGLGTALDIGLAEARGRAAEARRLRLDGRDPIDEKRASRAALAAMITFAEAGAGYVKAHAPGWRSEKHLRQWESSLANIVYPVIGDMPVDAIGVVDILRVLTPIWTEKPETANRVRNRIELILDAAKARGLRSGENPAAWRGHLDKLLPPRAKVRAVVHFSAIDYREIAGFMAQLRQQPGPAPSALAFAILTATRSGGVMGATWVGVDLDAKVWTIPAERTKARKEHRVPLSDPALVIPAEMAAIRMNDFVFPGQRGRLSPGMLLLALKRIGRADITPHGFRSAFRDWAGNESHFPRKLCEAALGHATGDATERAYRRSDALARRRELMDAWAWHCEGAVSDNIVTFKRQAMV